VNLTLGGLLNHPYGIALDVAGNKIYVANGGNVVGQNVGIGFVVRADLDGTNAARLTNLDTLLATQMFPQGMAIDVANNKMYVAVQNARVIQADLDGSNATALNLGGLLTGTPLDVAGNRIYVVTFEGNLFTADLSGNNAVALGNLGGLLNQSRGIGLDLVGQKMYMSNIANNTVVQADLPDATNPVALTVATLNMPAVIAVYRP
jgi:DNA-binding beta-propeller fold protein YncE